MPWATEPTLAPSSSGRLTSEPFPDGERPGREALVVGGVGRGQHIDGLPMAALIDRQVAASTLWVADHALSP